MRATHLKVLSPSLLQRLQAEQQQQQQETTAAIVSLLSLTCLPPAFDFPEELLLLNAAAAAVDTLQPRDIAVCLYALQQQQQQQQPQQQQQQQVMLLRKELKERLLERAALLLPSFPPDELLLFVAAAAAAGDFPTQLLQQGFRCMYTAIPFYRPQQLAAVSVSRIPLSPSVCCLLLLLLRLLLPLLLLLLLLLMLLLLLLRCLSPRLPKLKGLGFRIYWCVYFQAFVFFTKSGIKDSALRLRLLLQILASTDILPLRVRV